MATLRERTLFGFGLVAVERARGRAAPCFAVQVRHRDGRRWTTVGVFRTRALAEDTRAALRGRTERAVRVHRIRWRPD